MGKSINKAIILGNLGKDPEITYLSSGIPVAKFSIATSESWKDAEGNKQEKTEWHNVVAWRKLAEVCGQYLHKGSKIYVEGKIQTRSWDDATTGVKKYMTEIVVDNLVMLDGKQAEGVTHDEAPPATGGKNADADLPF